MELFLVAALAYAGGRFSARDDSMPEVLPGIKTIVFTYAAFKVLDVIYSEGKRQLKGSK